MRNLKLTLAYDGADFHGWQVQPGRSTVQGLLAEAIARITGESVLPQGSGRTDAGVHALAQVASVALAATIPAENLGIALNDLLPAAIRVTDVTEVEPGFHARKSAKGKIYRYRILRGDICPPFLARYVFHYPYPLDEQAMIEAAGEVEGEHDYTSFAAVDPERSAGEELQENVPKSNVRTIFSSRWARRPFPEELCPSLPSRGGPELVYMVHGSGFLHHMVRNLVGCFLLVGRGRLKREHLAEILQARSRAKNPGATAPAQGLYLVSVDY